MYLNLLSKFNNLVRSLSLGFRSRLMPIIAPAPPQRLFGRSTSKDASSTCASSGEVAAPKKPVVKVPIEVPEVPEEDDEPIAPSSQSKVVQQPRQPAPHILSHNPSTSSHKSKLCLGRCGNSCRCRSLYALHQYSKYPELHLLHSKHLKQRLRECRSAQRHWAQVSSSRRLRVLRSSEHFEHHVHYFYVCRCITL